MKQTGAEIIIRMLEQKGIEIIAGIPGSANLPLYDALYGSTIKHVLARHEQGAGFIAQGMARSTGKAAVCFATSGPGAMNLLTAIADAKLDSVPVVAFTGQVPTTLIGTDAFQEIDTYGLTIPITKKNFLVHSAAELLEVIPLAFYIAESGRPGPVVIDVPKDVQLQECIFEQWPAFLSPDEHHPANRKKTKEIATTIDASERPLLLVGAGVIESGAESLLLQFAEKNGIPVTSTLRGLGCFPPSHPLYLGMIGMHGTKCANSLMEEADLIIALGVRFGDRATGKASEFCKNARIIHIDIDKTQLNKNKPAHISLNADILRFLEAVVPLVTLNSRKKWLTEVLEKKNLFPNVSAPENGDLFHPLRVVSEVVRMVPSDTIITTDVGQHQMWVAQAYPFTRPRTFLTSGGLGTMGFGLPTAIGAALANPGKKIVCFSGDGSLLMNIQELATMAELKPNLVVLLFNNGYLGLVRQQQEMFFGQKYIASQFDCLPDFAAIARGFGLKAIDLSDAENPLLELEKALALQEPVFINIPINYSENVLPMVPPGAANKAMIGWEPKKTAPKGRSSLLCTECFRKA
jgi:acetolactate synthase I/II/III large subunit